MQTLRTQNQARTWKIVASTLLLLGTLAIPATSFAAGGGAGGGGGGGGHGGMSGGQSGGGGLGAGAANAGHGTHDVIERGSGGHRGRLGVGRGPMAGPGAAVGTPGRLTNNGYGFAPGFTGGRYQDGAGSQDLRCRYYGRRAAPEC